MSSVFECSASIPLFQKNQIWKKRLKKYQLIYEKFSMQTSNNWTLEITVHLLTYLCTTMHYPQRHCETHELFILSSNWHWRLSRPSLDLHVYMQSEVRRSHPNCKWAILMISKVFSGYRLFQLKTDLHDSKSKERTQRLLNMEKAPPPKHMHCWRFLPTLN